MPDSFVQYEEEFKNWIMSGYPGVRTETMEFIEHLFQRNRGLQIWAHQKEGILRVIYSYEIQNRNLGNKYLLRIVTGGGKSLIIASIIAWLKYSHSIEFDKFILVCPNLSDQKVKIASSISSCCVELLYIRDHNIRGEHILWIAATLQDSCT